MSDSGPIHVEKNGLIEALLAAYAAEALSEPFAVVIASHLQMMTDNRSHSVPVPLAAPEPPQGMGGAEPLDALMPLALRSYVDRQLAGAIEWRTILPGIKHCLIASDAGSYASFLRCHPGAAIPAHTHQGLEVVLVLQGGFHDVTGHYAIGDIAVADSTIDHRPVADRAGECIIFIVLGAPVKLTGPFGRFIPRTFGP